MGVDGIRTSDIFDEYYEDSNPVKIPSFQRDHNEIVPGLYVQEVKRNIAIYDLRFVKPNTEVIPIDAIHTIEHLFATWLKLGNNNIKELVVSFNPGGCQTMFYLELFTEPGMLQESYVAEVLIQCIDWSLKQTKVPGSSKEECGNYKSHNLEKAKEWLQRYKITLAEQFKI
jgi:S-ribosylhomocysteine lyase